MENAQKQYEWDVEVPDYAPGLYDYTALAEGLNGLESIDDAALTLYHQQGFLVVNDAFTPAEIQDAKQGLIDLIAEKNPNFSIIQFRSEVRDQLATLSLEERLNNVRKIGQFTDYDERLKAMAFHPKLVPVVESILGAKAELYQSMALIKPPKGREKPWHQDHAYFDLSLSTKVVGVWIALDEATPENGCMRVVPGWFHDQTFPHFMVRDWQLCDDASQEYKNKCVAVPLKPGGCLIFDSFLPHGTPSNYSPTGRKALQYHYLPAGTLRTPPAERLAIWGTEGKDVSC
ncbi:MAG: phytanoyl-CoA dioxygenase family protein [Acidobacteria bacterium]|nr:phytanoyl-CoA dioxygenase family protein [Acidobacteriota bacterium]